jgi:hypothetical protein
VKKVRLLIVSGLLAANAAYASNQVGQCVFPKTKTLPNGNLSLVKPTYISDKPSPEGAKSLTSMSSFRIDAEENGFIRLITTPDYSLPAPQTGEGKVVGWGKLKDFDVIALRNCT